MPIGMVDPVEAAGLLSIVGAQAGDRAALECVLRSLQGSLYDHIVFVLRDQDAAKDVLQDVLVKVARSIRQLRDPRLIHAWAYRIAHRAAVRELTRLRSVPQSAYEVAEDSTIDPIEEDLFDAQALDKLAQEIDVLPLACGAAIRLRYLEELSLAEIAAVLEIPVGTVKSRLNYGLTRLRERLAAP